MHKGDVGDRMYVNFKGSLGVYTQDDFISIYESDPIVALPVFSAVGENAIEVYGDKRSATIACLDEGKSIFLTLDKKDYQKLLGVSKF